MANALSFGVLCFSSLFTIINPLEVAPFFVSMTHGADARSRRRTALRACGLALGLLVVFAVSGGLIFRLFGITIDAFRIAGGILFFAMSMPMLTGAHRVERNEDGAQPGTDPAIVPLGMPMICGPGAISTVMVLMGQSGSTVEVVSFFLALVAVIGTTALILFVAPAAVRRLGRSGVEVMTQVMGLIMCVIGIQFIINGVRPIVIEILTAAR